MRQIVSFAQRPSFSNPSKLINYLLGVRTIPTLFLRNLGLQSGDPSSKMSSAIERPFIETRSHNDRPMNVFLSDSDGFSSGIAPKCLIGHRSADHRYRMSFAGRYDRKPSSVVSWR
ncbi:hypothetical protein AVEN_240943-1 [Araneus ventricosus]|uniref:Uncharacterized protein n=1 Tax=Araneus ventricosus TaxID=182803 RepID=A0A4Y2JTY5_ARAVE|nr:hypothetical protein AVEN_240943-1 [Araneus ventricosus]